MRLPPWNCVTVEEQEAFAEFILSELLEMDVAETNSMRSDLFIDYMNEETKNQEFEQLARDIGRKIPPAARPRGRPRVPNQGTPLECAILDVERMRSIFRRYWGKANRHARPTREDIAADYWELSVDDREQLRRHFTKASKP